MGHEERAVKQTAEMGAPGLDRSGADRPTRAGRAAGCIQIDGLRLCQFAISAQRRELASRNSARISRSLSSSLRSAAKKSAKRCRNLPRSLGLQLADLENAFVKDTQHENKEHVSSNDMEAILECGIQKSTLRKRKFHTMKLFHTGEFSCGVPVSLIRRAGLHQADPQPACLAVCYRLLHLARRSWTATKKHTQRNTLQLFLVYPSEASCRARLTLPNEPIAATSQCGYSRTRASGIG